MATSPVLIVDDDYDFRLMIRDLLERHGYQVVSFPGAAESLRFIQHHGVSLVLLDLSMPTINGFEFMRQLRALPVPQPPVIAVTGLDLMANEPGYSRITALGARRFFKKPVEIDDLLSAMADLLDERESAGSDDAANVK